MSRHLNYKYVDDLMDKNAQITGLTSEQHKQLREIAEIRHNIHTYPAQIFCDTRLKRKIDAEFIMMATSDIFGEEEMEEELTEIYKIYNNLMTYRDVETPEQINSVVDAFISGRTILNDKIESFLRSVDQAYGTKYCPSGKLRKNIDYDAKTRQLISNQLMAF